MLTKEIIEREIRIWKRNGCEDGTVTARHYFELCRLALLGLERDATIAAAQSAGHKAGRAAATAEYKAEIERLHGVIKGWELKWSQRDERAERIGRLVLSWRCGTCGMDAVKLYGGFVRSCDRCGPALKRTIADAMEDKP